MDYGKVSAVHLPKGNAWCEYASTRILQKVASHDAHSDGLGSSSPHTVRWQAKPRRTLSSAIFCNHLNNSKITLLSVLDCELLVVLNYMKVITASTCNLKDQNRFF